MINFLRRTQNVCSLRREIRCTTGRISELQRYFGVYDVLTEASAPDIWERVNRKIQSGDFSARRLIQRSNVMLIGTTDDPASDLKYHLLLKEEKDFRTKSSFPPSGRDMSRMWKSPASAGDMAEAFRRGGKPGSVCLRSFRRPSLPGWTFSTASAAGCQTIP